MVFALLSVSSCHSNDDELVVFAAASLTDVLTEVKEKYELQNTTRVQYNFGGSQSLAVELSNLLLLFLHLKQLKHLKLRKTALCVGVR